MGGVGRCTKPPTRPGWCVKRFIMKGSPADRIFRILTLISGTCVMAWRTSRHGSTPPDPPSPAHSPGSFFWNVPVFPRENRNPGCNPGNWWGRGVGRCTNIVRDDAQPKRQWEKSRSCTGPRPGRVLCRLVKKKPDDEKRENGEGYSALLTFTDCAWANSPSASAIVSTISPMDSSPSRSIISTDAVLQKCATSSPEYIFEYPAVGRQ